MREREREGDRESESESSCVRERARKREREREREREAPGIRLEIGHDTVLRHRIYFLKIRLLAGCVNQFIQGQLA